MNIRALFGLLEIFKTPIFIVSIAFAIVVYLHNPANTIIDIISILVGLTLLVMAGDILVNGASDIGYRIGLNPLLIGILIVGLGTSAPEIITVAIAGFQDATDLALGNVIGSNIANIALVMGAGLLLLKKPIHVATKWREYTGLMLATVIMTSVVFWYGKVDFIASIIFIICLISYLVYTINYHNKTKDITKETEQEVKEIIANHWFPPFLGIIFGLIGLILGADVLVGGAVNIATSLNVQEKIIGLTIVAIGTSLPELAATYAAAKKGHGDMVFGNVIGSNIFNLLAASSAGGLFVILPTANVKIDTIIMLAFTTAILLLMLKVLTPKKIGILFIVSYIIFLVWTGYSAGV